MSNDTGEDRNNLATIYLQEILPRDSCRELLPWVASLVLPWFKTRKDYS